MTSGDYFGDCSVRADSCGCAWTLASPRGRRCCWLFCPVGVALLKSVLREGLLWPTASLASDGDVRLASPLRRGFFAASTPEMLRRCRTGPGSSFLRTPGDALLHFALSNFSSPVCSSIALAPSSAPAALVGVEVLLPSPALTATAVALLLKVWLGSKFESPYIRQFSSCIFSVTVASNQIAQFIVSLEGINFKGLVVSFHVDPPDAARVQKLFFLLPFSKSQAGSSAATPC